jgi:seryl-tRNA synthetase
MIDVQLLRKEPDKVKQGIAAKNADPALVDKFLALDEEWRKATAEADALRAEQKKLAEARDIEGGKKKKEEVRAVETRIAAAEAERLAAWRLIPNPPLPDVPVGKSDADNTVAREVGEKPQLQSPKDYLALAEPLGLIDMERAAKVSGSRFGYVMGDAALLELALVQLAIRTVTDRNVLADIMKKNNLSVSDAPFVPVIPPVLISKDSMGAMGYLDRGADEIYHLPADDMYLVGTSEQSIGPMHEDEVFDAKDLPKRYLGFSTCFRREAGSYGKDTKGILRVHQFDKAEMFSFVAPESSGDEHKLLLGIEEHLMQALKLPYHVLDICSADLGDPAAKKWDIEAWMPGQNGGKGEYRETHSTSNCTDYQARRLNIKYRATSGTEFVHTLNGTAFAIGRTLIAIMENYQTEDGKIRVPEVLQAYVGKDLIG